MSARTAQTSQPATTGQPVLLARTVRAEWARLLTLRSTLLLLGTVGIGVLGLATAADRCRWVTLRTLAESMTLAG